MRGTNSFLVFTCECELGGIGPRNNRLPRATIKGQTGENLSPNNLDIPLIGADLGEVRV